MWWHADETFPKKYHFMFDLVPDVDKNEPKLGINFVFISMQSSKTLYWLFCTTLTQKSFSEY